MGGPANNAGLVFLNPRRGILAVSLPFFLFLSLVQPGARFIGHRRDAGSFLPSRRRQKRRRRRAGAAYLSLFTSSLSGVQHARAKTVSRSPGCAGGMGKGGGRAGGDPPNELSRLLKRGPRRAAVRPRIEERKRGRKREKSNARFSPWSAALCR